MNPDQFAELKNNEVVRKRLAKLREDLERIAAMSIVPSIRKGSLVVSEAVCNAPVADDRGLSGNEITFYITAVGVSAGEIV